VNIHYEECSKMPQILRLLSYNWSMKKWLLKISGYSILMEDEAVSRESVTIREKIVLPLLVIQQNALFHISQESEYKELYEKIVTRSLYGNINASRNSA
ncbi:MAG: hypothetical protein AAFU74_17440, partial [Bacteroidota bacterium]